MIHRVIAFSLIFIGVLKAQGQPCSCLDKFVFVKKNIEANYAGFFDKVHAKSQPIYKAFIDSLSKEATMAKADFDCFKITNTYVRYFKDKHTLLHYAEPPSDLTIDEVRSYYRPLEQVKIDSARIIRYLNQNKSRLDPIEGIYTSNSKIYKVAIFRKPKKQDEFIGIILHAANNLWLPGDVKIEAKRLLKNEYEGVIYNLNHTPWISSLKLTGNVLEANSGDWYRIEEADNKDNDIIIPQTTTGSIPSDFKEFNFKKLSEYTNVIRVPDFFKQNKNKLDSIIGSNLALINTMPNLIIDVRSNGGGQDFVYDTLVALAYTNEIMQYNIEMRASEENIELYEKAGLKAIANEMRKSNTGFIVRKMNAIVKNNVYPYPKQIVVLVDKRIGSSGEQFILSMKQSGKVTVIGENTSGTLDYGEPVPVPVPCTKWVLRRATSKHGRLPEYSVDRNGVTPDVYVPEHEEDWIDFSRRLMEKRSGR